MTRLAKRLPLRLTVATALLGLGGAALAEPLPKVALIIDDVGYRLSEGHRAVRLPGAVAVAILPHTAHSTLLAREAEARGKEVVLHLPMQPIEAAEDPGPGALQLAHTRSEFATIFAADLATVPYARGVSNHMGSLLTRNPGPMRWLMEELKEREPLFFVDSYTTAASVGLTIARESGVPALRGDLSPEAIELQWRRLLAKARESGAAVGIGHPHAETLALLERELPRLAALGLELVPLTALLPGAAHEP